MNYKKLLFVLGCGLAFSFGNLKAQTITFNYTGTTQTWTVPCGVTSVTMSSYGAQGGTVNSGSYVGGLGAEMVGTFTVTPGEILTILVGGQGTGTVNSNSAGGGGGGSFIMDVSTPLLIAGGGGGRRDTGPAGSIANTQGTSSTTAQNSYDNTGIGGTAGNGGTSGEPAGGGTGGPGGGLNTNGGLDGSAGGGPGFSYTNGGAGGAGCISGSDIGGAGGYGGGGGGTWCYRGTAGGGGGYSGGGTGVNDAGAGGGGSYNSGSNQTNTTGANSGNGKVVINWTLPAALTATAHTTTNETCNGGNNGSAASTVTGGSIPYTYAWTGGGTNATVSGLTAGSYTVTVHDNCGNSASASVSITQPTAIVATITSTNVLCNGGNTGSASSTVTGGSTPYTYAWTGGGSNSSITGLTAGTYNLNVQDANGCTGSATVTITQPNILMVSDSVTANVWCHGDSTGSASSKVSGGTMPYMYTWTGGGTTDTAVGLKAGTYTLAVQDANGCTGTAMVTITEPTALAIVKHAAADNGSSNGKAWVNVSGGVSPYTYAWTGGNTTDSISGQAKGTYCCTVKDANGCMDSVCIKIVSTAGIDGITSDGGQITVYPNPNNGQFTIQSSLNAVSTVEVYNVLGEKVFSGNLNAGNNTINMSNQSTGIYLYRVMSESGTLISEGKISVQK